VLPDHLAQRGLRDLVDGSAHVLDGHHRLDRVDDLEVGDRRDVDADVVARDDPLRLDRHRDDAQGYAAEHVDDGNDRPQPRCADADDLAEPEVDAHLVLLHDANREQQGEHRQDNDNDRDDE